MGCGEKGNNQKENEQFTGEIFAKDTIIDGLSSVKIGNQIWMKSNLDTEVFNNGDTIQEVQSNPEWLKLKESKQPAWCYPNSDASLGETLGKLYNGYTIDDSRGVAPKGWHVPTINDWEILRDYLGGELIAGELLKSKNYWFNDKNGLDILGFSALPAGCRFSQSPSLEFTHVYEHAEFWSSTSTEYNTFRIMNIFWADKGFYNNFDYKHSAFPIRLIKD